MPLTKPSQSVAFVSAYAARLAFLRGVTAGRGVQFGHATVHVVRGLGDLKKVLSRSEMQVDDSVQITDRREFMGAARGIEMIHNPAKSFTDRHGIYTVAPRVRVERSYYNPCLL
jgi:hypothetical protein